MTPLPYHVQISEYLWREHREIWDWYAKQQPAGDQAEAVRFELLKSTYRIEPETQPELYAQAKSAAETLGLDVPITIYQAQNPQGLNASLACLNDQAHIVLHGPVTKTLGVAEQNALLAHELSHLLLWRGWEGRYWIVDQVLAALSCDASDAAAPQEAMRLFQLYNEVFCDRGALAVVGQTSVVVSMLVKVLTGVSDVDPESYLRQAREILEKTSVRADQYTHPEAYIRAAALQLWEEQNERADERIAEMIEGPPTLDRLDLLGQQRMQTLTRRLVDHILSPAWMQNPTTLAHARRFFSDFAPAENAHQDADLAAMVAGEDSIADYVCYLWLDFASVDRDLEEYPLAWALTHCEALGIKSRMIDIARKELRLRKSQLDAIDGKKERLLEEAAAALQSS